MIFDFLQALRKGITCDDYRLIANLCGQFFDKVKTRFVLTQSIVDYCKVVVFNYSQELQALIFRMPPERGHSYRIQLIRTVHLESLDSHR